MFTLRLYARIFCMILYHFCFAYLLGVSIPLSYGTRVQFISCIYVISPVSYGCYLFLFTNVLCPYVHCISLPQRPLCCFKLPVSQVNPGFHWFCLKRVHECLYARAMLHHYIFLTEFAVILFYFY